MKVHDDALDGRRQLREDFFDGFKRTGRTVFHENASEQGYDGNFSSGGIAEDPPAASGLERTEIGRPDQIFYGEDLLFEIFLVPGMVAGREHIDRFLHVMDAGEAVTGAVGGIFAVGDDERSPVPLFQDRDEMFDGRAAALADDIADKQQIQYRSSHFFQNFPMKNHQIQPIFRYSD